MSNESKKAPFEGAAIEISSLNGYKYKFEEVMFFGKISVMSFYWDKSFKRYMRIGKEFGSLDEAKAWVAEIDRKVSAPKPEPEEIVVPNDYYGVKGRYYGD